MTASSSRYDVRARAAACLPVSGRAAQPSDIQIVNGTCDPSSHIAEGPLGADLTKRQSRFYCNSAVITFFDDYKGHVMIQFAQKESHHGPILSFSGKVGGRRNHDVCRPRLSDRGTAYNGQLRGVQVLLPESPHVGDILRYESR